MMLPHHTLRRSFKGIRPLTETDKDICRILILAIRTHSGEGLSVAEIASDAGLRLEVVADLLPRLAEQLRLRQFTFPLVIIGPCCCPRSRDTRWGFEIGETTKN